MAYSLHHKYSGSWVDISDYLNSEPFVPYVDRNRDYTLRSTGFDMYINFNYSNLISKNDEIKVEDGSSNVIFSGYVSKSSMNYTQRKIIVNVESHLMLLSSSVITDSLKAVFGIAAANFTGASNFYIEDGTPTEFDPDLVVDTGHGLSNGDRVMFDVGGDNIEAYQVYYAKVEDVNKFEVHTNSSLTSPILDLMDIDGIGGTYISGAAINEDKYFTDRVQVLFAIQSMFDDVGLSLTITGMDSSLVGQFVANSSTVNFHLDDFSILFDDMWNINQSEYDTIDKTRLITYRDFISEYFTQTSTVIKCIGEKAYQLVRGESEEYTINDLNGRYESNDVEPKYSGVKYELKYQGDSIDDLETGDGTIDIFENYVLRFGQANQGGTYNNEIWLPTKNSLTPTISNVGLSKRIRSLTQGYNEKKYTALLETSFKQVVENYICIAEMNKVSEIIQEDDYA